MKLFFKVLLGIFLLFILLGAGGIFYLSRGLETGGKLAVNGVTPMGLSDGVYNGVYESGRWSNEVKVTVKGGKIIEINLLKDVTFPKEEVTKEIFARVVEKQNTSVDTVAGSTVTSKAYLMAIENALKK